MAIVFKYMMLMAIPDRGRGERVNVGALVFLPNRVDIRLAEIGKLRALTGAGWESYAEDMRLRLRLLQKFSQPADYEKQLLANPRIDPYFETTKSGWFSIDGPEEYEDSVREILRALVSKPRPSEARQQTTGINVEIARTLRKSNALAARDEPREEHRVHRDYSFEDKLTADFIQKNGVHRVSTTLDLRRPRVDFEESALKAITLDQAKKKFGRKTQTTCVYASKFPDEDRAQSSIKLIKRYANHIFNWEVPDEKSSFMKYVFDGMGRAGPLM